MVVKEYTQRGFYSLFAFLENFAKINGVKNAHYEFFCPKNLPDVKIQCF